MKAQTLKTISYRLAEVAGFAAGLLLGSYATGHAALVMAVGQGIANEPQTSSYTLPAVQIYDAAGHIALGYVNEGVNHGTDGVFVQYRVTRQVLSGLQVSAAVGPEILNTMRHYHGAWANAYKPSLLVSLGISYRVSPVWRVGLKWSHVTFQQSARYGYRDADMILATIGVGL